jgi:phage baseplate assembly protein W
MPKYKGIIYPLCKHHQGFLHHADSDLEQLKCNMATIVLTEPGERVVEPYFGTKLLGVNLNNPEEVVKDVFRQNVANAIKQWEKRVQVQDIKINLNVYENNLIVMISVYFINPLNLKDIEELHIQKSLGGIDGRPMPF